MKQVRQSILMRVIILWVAMALWALPGFAQDLGKGINAFNEGKYQVALTELKPLAEAGNAKAQFFMGEMYGWGRGVKRDYARARKWYLKASKQNMYKADSRLALYYLSGFGVAKDEMLALFYAQRGANNNDETAQYLLGRFYEAGRAGLSVDNRKAVKWYKAAVDNGYLSIYEDLGRAYEKIGDFVNAEKWYQKAVDRGDEDARKPLARLKAQNAAAKQTTSNSRKVVSPKSSSSSSPSSGSAIAVEYPDEAARQSSDRVWEDDKDDFLVGANAYLDGDFSLALEFLYPLAEKGVPYAQYYMGEIFDRGLGINQNPQAAVKWFKAAYKNGVSRAGHNLAYIYYTGSAGFVDHETAVDIFHREARAGNRLSQVSLGHAYTDGKGVVENHKTAVKWYRMGAENGDPVGMFQLGLAYYRELGGVSWDYNKAYMWFSLAHEGGVNEALSFKEEVREKLTAERRDLVGKMIAKCRQRDFKGC